MNPKHVIITAPKNIHRIELLDTGCHVRYMFQTQKENIWTKSIHISHLDEKQDNKIYVVDKKGRSTMQRIRYNKGQWEMVKK